MTEPIPLQRDPSQADRALLGIRDLVLRGEFKAGERLPELELCPHGKPRRYDKRQRSKRNR